MLEVVGCSILEVIEVKGLPLKEQELWAILAEVSSLVCTDKYDVNDHTKNMIITPRSIMLLPNGKVVLDCKDVDRQKIQFSPFLKLDYCDKDQKNHVLVHSLALTVLWCAEYNLVSNAPLDISDKLQNTLTEMCETRNFTFESLQSHCNEMNPSSLSYKEVLVNLYQYVMGNLDEFHLCSRDYMTKEMSINIKSATQNILEDRMALSRVNDFKFLGQTYSLPAEESNKANSSKSISTMNSKPITDDVEKQVLNRLLTFSEPHKSILQYCYDEGQIVRVGDIAANDDDASFLYIMFLNRIKLKVLYGNSEQITVNSLLTTVTEHLKFETNCNSNFALATLEDDEFHFLDKEAFLSTCLSTTTPGNITTFHLKILIFPTNIAILRSSLLRAIYMQIRADVVDERLTCSHDDALDLCSLALQCEIGDYKAEYGLNYYSTEDYVSKHVINQLGVSYVRSQASVLHRQSAGIGQNEARLLFLRRCQNSDEYGMHMYLLYKYKTCKNDEALWLGAGPFGIIIFEMKHGTRTKKQSFRWDALQRITFKGKKINFIVTDSERKLKFYQKNISRSKYIVQLVSRMHRYYLADTPCNKFSSLALFDDITRLCSPMSALPTPPLSTRGADSHKTTHPHGDSSTREICSSSSFTSSNPNFDFDDQSSGRRSPSQHGSISQNIHHQQQQQQNPTKDQYFMFSPFNAIKTGISKRSDKLKFGPGSKNKTKSCTPGVDLLSITPLEGSPTTESRGVDHPGPSGEDGLNPRSKMYKLLPDDDDDSTASYHHPSFEQSSQEADC